MWAGLYPCRRYGCSFAFRWHPSLYISPIKLCIAFTLCTRFRSVPVILLLLSHGNILDIYDLDPSSGPQQTRDFACIIALAEISSVLRVSWPVLSPRRCSLMAWSSLDYICRCAHEKPRGDIATPMLVMRSVQYIPG